MNEWKDRKPHAATQEMISAEWGLRKQRLSCALCGHVFEVGSPGNFFVCSECDYEGLEEAHDRG